ncbi:hypothetical protein FJ420_32030, partial [Mesorhizobium sp. B3-1-3]
MTPAPRSFTPPSVLPDISPARGEIGCRRRFRQFSTSKRRAGRPKLPISPLAGEMHGGAEGG